MTVQPKWKLLTSTDRTAIYVDETGTYDPEMEVAEELDEESEERTVYRFTLERLKLVEHHDRKLYLVSERWRDEGWPHRIHQYEEWFVDSLDDVASSIGSTRKALVEALISAEPQHRAVAYEAIGGYHGFINLDHDPRTVDSWEP